MSSTEGAFSKRSNQVLHLDVSVSNSVASWNLYARRVSGVGSYANEASGSWSVNIGGNTAGGAFPAYNLQSNTTVGIAGGAYNITNGTVVYSSASAGGVTVLGNAYVSAADATAPGTPGTPSLSSTNPTQISTSWSAPGDGGSGITNYRAYYGTDPALAGAALFDTGSAAPSATITGLTPGRTYFVGVYAQNALGFGARSGINSIKVGIGGKRWDGSAEQPFTTAMRWDGAAEVPITTAVRWDGAQEIALM